MIAVILFVLFAIIMLVRLYDLVQILKTREFWIGVAMQMVFFYVICTGHYLFIRALKIEDEFYYFGSIIFFAIAWICIMVVSRTFRMPMKFLLGVVSLGFLAFAIDNRLNGNAYAMDTSDIAGGDGDLSGNPTFMNTYENTTLSNWQPNRELDIPTFNGSELSMKKEVPLPAFTNPMINFPQFTGETLLASGNYPEQVFQTPSFSPPTMDSNSMQQLLSQTQSVQPIISVEQSLNAVNNATLGQFNFDIDNDNIFDKYDLDLDNDNIIDKYDLDMDNDKILDKYDLDMDNDKILDKYDFDMNNNNVIDSVDMTINERMIRKKVYPTYQ